MNEYTPTVEELAKNTTIRDRRVVALTREERTRGIARVRADALREAADAISLVVIPGSDEDQARLRVIAKLKARGYPFPPPKSDEVLEMVKEGRWPPAGAQS